MHYDFTHLRLLTQYSISLSSISIKALAKELKRQGAISAAMSDDSHMFGALEFYKNIKKEGIKPIIGLGVCVIDDLESKSLSEYCILFLYAKNEAGYKNLMHLSSLPHIDCISEKHLLVHGDNLKKHSEGLVALMCWSGGHFRTLLKEDYKRARKKLLQYKQIFKDDLYLEFGRYAHARDEVLEKKAIKLSDDNNIKMVASAITTHLNEEDNEIIGNLSCIKNKRKRECVLVSNQDFYLKTPKQMDILFQDMPKTLKNTQEVANKCNFDLNTQSKNPPLFKFTQENAKKYNLPLSQTIFSSQNDDMLLAYLCKQGFEVDVKELVKELKIISSLKLSGSILMILDFYKEAKKSNISIELSFDKKYFSFIFLALGLIKKDKKASNKTFHGIIKDGSLNIKMKIDKNKRETFFKLIANRYGQENIANIGVVNRFTLKTALKDTARIYSMPYKEVKELTSLVVNLLDKNQKLRLDNIHKHPKIKEFEKVNFKATYILKEAVQIIGLPKNISKHPSKFVVSHEELWHKTPLYKKSHENIYTTQYLQDSLKEIGLLFFEIV